MTMVLFTVVGAFMVVRQQDKGPLKNKDLTRKGYVVIGIGIILLVIYFFFFTTDGLYGPLS